MYHVLVYSYFMRTFLKIVYADYKNVERMGRGITHSPTSKRQTPLKFMCFITGFLHNYILLKLFKLLNVLLLV